MFIGFIFFNLQIKKDTRLWLGIFLKMQNFFIAILVEMFFVPNRDMFMVSKDKDNLTN